METLQRTANRGSISTGFDIDNSLKLESDNSETLYRENSNGNRRTWTSSLWFKRTELTGSTTQHLLTHGVFTNGLRVFFVNENLYMDIADATSTYYRFISNQLFRDTSAWYHMVWRVDTTSSTATERARIYINGEEITWGTEPTVPQNYDTLANFSNAQIDEIQFSYRQASNYQNSYIAEFHHVDGQSLAPTDFGEFDADTGIWKPIEYTGTYGTNGCYLNFSNSSSLGADSSGNGNNFTLSNITSADQALDTPTNNFCTINVLQNTANYNTNVTTEGATEVYSTSNYSPVEASIGVMGGKWYWEGKYNVANVGHMPGIGVPGEWVLTAFFYVGRNDYGVGTLNGNWYYNGAVASSTDASSWSTGDIVSIALDMDNYKIYMAVNGSWAGTSNPATGSGGYDFSGASNLTSNFVVPVGRIETANASYPMELNFGGYTTMSIASGNSDSNNYGTFEFAPPTGYYALCTKNLAEYG